MTWRLYKKNDPNTWPQIDCPMVVYYPHKQYHDSEPVLRIAHWDNDRKQFYTPKKWWDDKEFYYVYISYVPSGYITTHATKCICPFEDRCAYEDDGYCMHDRNHACQHKQDVAEYSLEEKAIWKEFEQFGFFD